VGCRACATRLVCGGRHLGTFNRFWKAVSVQYVAAALTRWVVRRVSPRRRLVTQVGSGETCVGGYLLKWITAEPERCAVASQIKAAARIGDDPPTGPAGLWQCIVDAVSCRCPDSQMLGQASRALRMSRPGPADSRIMRTVTSGEHADLCLRDVRLPVIGSSSCRSGQARMCPAARRSSRTAASS
jgi:hypothetical protein